MYCGSLFDITLKPGSQLATTWGDLQLAMDPETYEQLTLVNTTTIEFVQKLPQGKHMLQFPRPRANRVVRISESRLV